MTVGKLRSVVLDAADIAGLASFYAELAGWSIVETDDDWITLHTADKQRVAFQLAPDHIPPQWPGQEHPQQAHLDLFIDDHAAAAERAIQLGATRLGAGATWITLADPAGHPFDLCQKDGVAPVMQLFAVTIDAPDTPALARFYAQLLGMELSYEGPEGALISGYDRSVMFQQIENYTPPQWPDPAHPQQVHLDVTVDDLDEGEAAVLALGATPLPGRIEDDFYPFADPAGHPFCLCIGTPR
jgi:catechol-2,3-dioxygenase